MASTRSSTRADPRFDGGAAPTVAKDHFADVEEALARLAHASYPPDAPGRGPASDRSADARISQSLTAATLGAADLRPPIPREHRSLAKLISVISNIMGTSGRSYTKTSCRRHLECAGLERGTLARVAIAVCLGASAIWAWRSYGGPARVGPAVRLELSATLGGPNPRPADARSRTRASGRAPAVERSAPPPAQAASQSASIAQPATTAANDPGAASAARQQVETSDLAALRQTVEQPASSQEQLTREIAKLQTEKFQADKPPAERPDKRMLRRVSAHPAPPVAAPTRKPTAMTPMPPQAARRLSTVSPLSPPPQPAPQIRSETQPSNPPRPPMPVPQP
jgi:hypothetical protein